MFVKICGMTSAEAARVAVAAGADALGFVFAPSPRRLTPAQALELCEGLSPDSVLRIAVLRHPSAALWQEVCEVFAPDWLQTDAEDLATLTPPPGAKLLPVYRNGRAAALADPPAMLLFEGHTSGTGRTADWNEAAALARRAQLVLAGGLGPANVAAAIERVRPWGVDVSSGVESSPGRKDPALIEAFIARARAAAENVEDE